MIRSISALALAAILAIPLAGPAAAQHDRDRGRPAYRHDDRGHGGNGGAVVGGALLGLGVGALLGGVIAAPAYAPPPAVYYAPPPPAYYAPPPPVYYGQ